LVVKGITSDIKAIPSVLKLLLLLTFYTVFDYLFYLKY
jgi:hypothetical protein